MTEVISDHRQLVAALRREKMRARLIESGLLVIAAKGFDNTVIEDVITHAGVARGTFYNHFPDIPALMLAARDALVDEMLLLTLSAVAEVADPAKACALGLRVALTVSAAYPLLARFSAQTGINASHCSNLVRVLLPPILLKGMAMGRFLQMPVTLAVDCVAATFAMSLQRQAAGEKDPFDAIIAAVLRLLNVPADEALSLAQLPVIEVVPDPNGLIVQSDLALRAMGLPDRRRA